MAVTSSARKAIARFFEVTSIGKTIIRGSSVQGQEPLREFAGEIVQNAEFVIAWSGTAATGQTFDASPVARIRRGCSQPPNFAAITTGPVGAFGFGEPPEGSSEIAKPPSSFASPASAMRMTA